VDDVCLDIYAPSVALCCDDFEGGSGGCWTWETRKTCAGDFWEYTTEHPCCSTSDYDGDGYNWFCTDYPMSGKGLNDALYTEIDLTDPELSFAEIEFAYAFCMEPDAAAYVEISLDYDPATDECLDATWIPYWEYVSPGYYCGDWELLSFDLAPFLGEKIWLRIRYTTPGNNWASELFDHGFAVDGFMMNYKMITFVDDVAPITQMCYDDPTGTVVLLAYDPAGPATSGVCNTYYKLDGGPTTEYTGPFVLSEGSHIVEYWSVDCAGNEESHKTSPTLTVDTTPPTVEITEPVEGIYLFGNQILQQFGPLCIGKVTIKADASDAGTGVSFVSFNIDGDSGFDASAPYEYLFRGPAFGQVTVTATAQDGKGLTAQDTATFTIYSLGLL
jgi:hypothetical protein